LSRCFEPLRERIVRQSAKFVVLRIKRVRNPDVVCIERLEHFLRHEVPPGVTVLLAGVRPDTLTLLKNIGFENWFPQEQVFPEEERQYSATLRAVRHAYSKLEELEPERADRPEHVLFSAESKLYYLV
jgi:SulP family sulfate permease